MFAVGDKVFYHGKGILQRGAPYRINRVVNDFLYIEHHAARYKANSFSKEGALDKQADHLLAVLTQKVQKESVGVCSYALEFSGGVRRFQVKDICHARLAYGNKWVKGTPENNKQLLAVALNVSGHVKWLRQVDDKLVEMYKRHVKYIVTESPWRYAFIQKPLKDVYDSGIYLDIEQDFSYCVAAAVALRTGSEFKQLLPMFQRLLDLGFSPNVAYVTTHIKGTSTEFSKFGGGHHVINNTMMTMEQIADFFNDRKMAGERVAYKDAAYKPYYLFRLINDRDVLHQEQVSVHDHILNTCEHIVNTHNKQFGTRYKYIDASIPDHQVILANAFAKVIK